VLVTTVERSTDLKILMDALPRGVREKTEGTRDTTGRGTRS
jgi:hypothetical protein